MTNDGKENIQDDYGALLAAVELYQVTKKPAYREAADRPARNLLQRLVSWKSYRDYGAWSCPARAGPVPGSPWAFTSARPHNRIVPGTS